MARNYAFLAFTYSIKALQECYNTRSNVNIIPVQKHN